MDFWDNLWDRLQSFGETFIEWVILLAVALLILLVGRWIIRLVSKWIGRLLDMKPLDGVWERSGVSRALAAGDQTPGSVASTILYAYLMVGLFVVVARVLELTSIEDLLTRLLAWIPLLLLAAVIVIIAAAAGSWAAGLVKPFAEAQNVPWLTYVVHVGVVVFGLLFAMDLMEVNFAEDIVKIVIGAGTVALAIAFGVGGIDAGKKWWAKYGSPGGSSGSQGGSPPPTSHD
jgi:hypothetical protein